MTKLAIITGASSGIGMACAHQLLSDGFLVINVSRRPCTLETVTNICGDLSDTDNVHKLGDQLLSVIRTFLLVMLLQFINLVEVQLILIVILVLGSQSEVVEQILLILIQLMLV